MTLTLNQLTTIRSGLSAIQDEFITERGEQFHHIGDDVWEAFTFMEKMIAPVDAAIASKKDAELEAQVRQNMPSMIIIALLRAWKLAESTRVSNWMAIDSLDNDGPEDDQFVKNLISELHNAERTADALFTQLIKLDGTKQQEHDTPEFIEWCDKVIAVDNQRHSW